MSYASAKGYEGEIQVAEFLNKIFGEFGYEFMRVGGVEKTKRVFAGDVVLRPKRGVDNSKCVLSPYFIESKKKAAINFWADADKAHDDAEYHGKRSYLLFVQKQAKGEKVRGRRLVVMEWETLGQILRELQGFKNEEKQ